MIQYVQLTAVVDAQRLNDACETFEQQMQGTRDETPLSVMNCPIVTNY
jgi:hypothetical protein